VANRSPFARLSDAEIADLLGDNELRNGDAYMTAAEATSLLAEIRDRRKHDRELARHANVCRGYYNRHGNTPTAATMDLLDEVDRLLEGAERK
jgi:hypothetical protein